MAALAPSPDSALIIAVALPLDLERLRLRHVPDAAAGGIPAHVTLLYPFAVPGSIDAAVLLSIDRIAAGRRGWSMRLAGLGRWPDTLHATVEPDAPVRALQRELAAAFPGLPPYGEPGLRFEPHVTVVQGSGARDPALAEDPAWSQLPVRFDVSEIALIVRQAGRWRVSRVFPLAGGATVRR